MLPENPKKMLLGGRIVMSAPVPRDAIGDIAQHALADADQRQNHGDLETPMANALRRVRTGRCLRFSKTRR